jgi:uncharacterized protein (TIGR00369 family)
MSADGDLTLKAGLSKLLNAMPFAPALGVEIVAATHGSVTLEAPLSPEFEAPSGSFAASPVGTLGDMAAMLSVTSALPTGGAMSTMDFTVKMLGTAQGTRLRAIGQAKQVGKTTCVGAAEIMVKQDGNWVACGTLLATGRRISFD